MRTTKEIVGDKLTEFKETVELLKVDERFFQRKLLKEKGFEQTLANIQQHIKDLNERIEFLEEVMKEQK